MASKKVIAGEGRAKLAKEKVSNAADILQRAQAAVMPAPEADAIISEMVTATRFAVAELFDLLLEVSSPNVAVAGDAVRRVVIEWTEEIVQKWAEAMGIEAPAHAPPPIMSHEQAWRVRQPELRQIHHNNPQCRPISKAASEELARYDAHYTPEEIEAAQDQINGDWPPYWRKKAARYAGTPRGDEAASKLALLNAPVDSESKN